MQVFCGLTFSEAAKTDHGKVCVRYHSLIVSVFQRTGLKMLFYRFAILQSYDFSTHLQGKNKHYQTVRKNKKDKRHKWTILSVGKYT